MVCTDGSFVRLWGRSQAACLWLPWWCSPRPLSRASAGCFRLPRYSPYTPPFHLFSPPVPSHYPGPVSTSCHQRLQPRGLFLGLTHGPSATLSLDSPRSPCFFHLLASFPLRHHFRLQLRAHFRCFTWTLSLSAISTCRLHQPHPSHFLRCRPCREWRSGKGVWTRTGPVRVQPWVILIFLLNSPMEIIRCEASSNNLQYPSSTIIHL